MPQNILVADTMFPHFTEEQSTDDKITLISNYLFILLEQLRYNLTNLDASNFNEAGLNEVGKILTDPVYMRLENDEGQIAEVSVLAEGLISRLYDQQTGDITTLTATASALGTRMTTAEGNISTLTQTAYSLTSRISDAEGNISTLSQTVNGLTLSVTNGNKTSQIGLYANGMLLSSQLIQINGMVTFSDLSTYDPNNTTIINGGNIKTGTITAIDISGSNVYGSVFRTLLSANGNVGGEVKMYYLNYDASDYYLAGGIKLDDQGAGTTDEARYRLFIYSNTVYGIPFALKLQSAGGASFEAASHIFMAAGYTNPSGYIKIVAPTVSIQTNAGGFYINGVPFQPTA